MNFKSDNAASVCPAVLDAILSAAPSAAAAYDDDEWSSRLDGAFSALFGHDCTVLPVNTGTAANALALAAMVPGYGAVVCETDAHIHVDECGAPEFFTGGAKLLLVKGEHGRLTPERLAAGLAAHRGDAHQVQIGALSLTQATEAGTVYTPDMVAALAAHAKARGWRVHMDGARFANAVAHLGCHPGDVTWRAGVDVLSFGAIKNGGMTAEALVVFAPDLAPRLRFLRKRAGQMPSKGRFQAAQLLAMIEGDVWLANARAANAAAAQLAAAAGARLRYPVEANELFLKMHPGEVSRLRAQGFDFYDWGDAGSDEIRLVTAWDIPPAHVAALAEALEQ
ncbi:MAG: threonine aldolase family protein [Polymorphobacter sp.]|uniref:threonine aldolase family protein n=1 Tax=Polymorphobacter sp. TaxID=1909290 RepID=UPI003A8788FC